MAPVTALTAMAGALGLFQVIPYIRSILRGDTKPSRVACIIWLMMDLVTFAGLVTVGFSGAAWLTLAFICTQLVIIGLLPKYGVGGRSKYDLICFAVGIIAVIGWIIIYLRFANAVYGAIFAVILTTTAVAVANVNMLRKLVRMPLSEDILAWSLTALAAALTIATLILGHSRWIDYLPVTLTLTTSTTVVALQFHQKRRQHLEKPAIN